MAAPYTPPWETEGAVEKTLKMLESALNEPTIIIDPQALYYYLTELKALKEQVTLLNTIVEGQQEIIGNYEALMERMMNL